MIINATYTTPSIESLVIEFNNIPTYDLPEYPATLNEVTITPLAKKGDSEHGHITLRTYSDGEAWELALGGPELVRFIQKYGKKVR